jgi:hypothetical protein
VIVFVPAYDEPTTANHAVARDLPSEDAHRWLLDVRATRENLLNVLGGQPDPLFAMAHGRPHCLLGQGGDHALLARDAPLLERRPVFAFACHTAAQLGRDMARQGVIWWGYIIEVSAPDDRELLRPLFVGIFAYIRSAFADAGSPGERLDVLMRTKERCDHAAETVDALADSDPALDVMDALRSLRDIWQLLRIWSPGAEAPERHPHAPDVAPRSLWL